MSIVSNDLWIYDLISEDRNLAIGGLLLTLLGLLIFVTLRAPFEILFLLFVYAIITIISVLPLFFLKRVIEIDRKRGTIKKWWKILNFGRDKYYNLSDFNEVRVYRRFSLRAHMLVERVIALSGPSISLKLLATANKDKAEECSHELAEFLALPLVDTTR